MVIISNQELATLLTTTTTLCDDDDFNETVTTCALLSSLLGCAPKDAYENQLISETFIESLSDSELASFEEKIVTKENAIKENSAKILVKKSNNLGGKKNV